MSNTISTNNINLHYYDYPGNSELPLILLPGLTANARLYDGLISAGLSPAFRTLALDLRGRGLSDKPKTGYHMADHADDVIGIMDALGIEQAAPVGHSYGGLLTFYMGAKFPHRFPKLVIMDASILLIREETREAIKASLARLGAKIPSMDIYISALKQLPTLNGFWSEELESYFKGDVQQYEDGSVQALADPIAINEAIDTQFGMPWADYVASIAQPTLLLNALGDYGTVPLMPKEMAEATVAMLQKCRYREIAGNHLTMVFDEGARQIVSAIKEFV